MALTGLFLCTFLVGHLLGNLQLILKTGEEGRRAFNEYAYFMGHNPFIKILSYVTYAAVIIHIIDGFQYPIAVTTSFVVACIIGMLIGRRLINLIDLKTVQKVFAVVVICVAIYLVITSLMKILPMLSL